VKEHCERNERIQDDGKIQVARLQLDKAQPTPKENCVVFDLVASLIFSDTCYTNWRWGTFRFGVKEAIFRLKPENCTFSQREMLYRRAANSFFEFKVDITEKKEERVKHGYGYRGDAKADMSISVNSIGFSVNGGKSGEEENKIEKSTSLSRSEKDIYYTVSLKGVDARDSSVEWSIRSLAVDKIIDGDVFMETENAIGKVFCNKNWSITPEIDIMPGCEVLLSSDFSNLSKKELFEKEWKIKKKLAAILVGKEAFSHVPFNKLRGGDEVVS